MDPTYCYNDCAAAQLRSALSHEVMAAARGVVQCAARRRSGRLRSGATVKPRLKVWPNVRHGAGGVAVCGAAL
eukprot:NODE_19793_length_827_cov_3.480000.p3 GENE.NODE_19793_length_827_cov_3.480000~~NODE_19793_length_827_cov_3.480000.p3  ORF type:complete len:73 (-),score=8.93 NODE_19793_length_827_cov_3.480000:258-476(-)